MHHLKSRSVDIQSTGARRGHDSPARLQAVAISVRNEPRTDVCHLRLPEQERDNTLDWILNSGASPAKAQNLHRGQGLQAKKKHRDCSQVLDFSRATPGRGGAWGGLPTVSSKSLIFLYLVQPIEPKGWFTCLNPFMDHYTERPSGASSPCV